MKSVPKCYASTEKKNSEKEKGKQNLQTSIIFDIHILNVGNGNHAMIFARYKKIDGAHDFVLSSWIIKESEKAILWLWTKGNFHSRYRKHLPWS